MTLTTQQDFEEAARKTNQYLMRLEDREVANQIYDFIVALSNAEQEFRKAMTRQKEASDHYYQLPLDAERHNDVDFDRRLIDLLKAVLAKSPGYKQNSGIAYIVFYADGSGGLQENLNDGWNNPAEFVTWLKKNGETK